MLANQIAEDTKMVVGVKPVPHDEVPALGDYSRMASYYDVIMTSGYYDYQAIVDQMMHHRNPQSILEIGAGTGLILEQLVTRRKVPEVLGIDLTQAMLDIAHKRLDKFPNVKLQQQNVCTMNLDKKYELAFSYGGVWYFVVGPNEKFMVSHIPDHDANILGFEKMANSVQSGGTLLLGIQCPHTDYEKPISNGMKYSQKIYETPIGFRKDYYLKDNGVTVMAQTLDYRTYSFETAIQLLADFGFHYVPKKDLSNQLFMEFKKR